MRKARFTLAPLRRQLRAALPPKMCANQPEQAATLKRLAKAAYELDAFNPHSPDDILITATSAAIQI